MEYIFRKFSLKINYYLRILDVIKLLSIAVDLDDLLLLEIVLESTADLMLEIKQIDHATFFFNQMRLFFSYTLNYSGKCRALQGLAECSIQIHSFYAAIIFLKRALQYAWVTNDIENEIKIFSKMALNYFYLGMIEKSTFFHQRATLGSIELFNSPIKMISADQLQSYNKSLAFTFKNITKLLLTYMSIPLKDLTELPQQSIIPRQNYVNEVTPRILQDHLKNVMYKKMKGVDLIENIIKNDPDFQIEIPTPRFQSGIVSEFAKMKQEIAPAVRKKRSNQRQSQSYDRTYDLQNSSIYKLPLDQRITSRVNSPPTIEDITQKLRNNLNNKAKQRSNLEMMKSPILLNHLSKESEIFSRARKKDIFRDKLQKIMQKHIQIWVSNKQN